MITVRRGESLLARFQERAEGKQGRGDKLDMLLAKREPGSSRQHDLLITRAAGARAGARTRRAFHMAVATAGHELGLRDRAITIGIDTLEVGNIRLCLALGQRLTLRRVCLVPQCRALSLRKLHA